MDPKSVRAWTNSYQPSRRTAACVLPKVDSAEMRTESTSSEDVYHWFLYKPTSVTHEVVDESVAGIDARVVKGDPREDAFHVDLISYSQIAVREFMNIRGHLVQL